MVAIFGLAACINFHADFIWYLVGFICLLLDVRDKR